MIVAGIDDWAFRKNHRYGTIVCDLERRRIVTLLPDREIATVRAWLSDHPEIMVVSRDRGGGYGEAAAKALPDAVQVADRWHLMENKRGVPQRGTPFHAAAPQSVRRRSIQNCSLARKGCSMKGISDASRRMPPSWRSSETQCHSRRSSVEQDTAVNSFAKSVAARVRMSSGHGKARSMPTCFFWMRNGAGAAVTAQSSGIVYKGKASKAPCVSSVSGRHGDDGPRRRPINNCKKCHPREQSHD
ncbi:hypothetical protein NB311A_09621 [Nitrobacter sp. Nb-311A]|nr:hypothetical protein NB311A_09621 [Nitrobacter sp. Nb-311A]